MKLFLLFLPTYLMKMVGLVSPDIAKEKLFKLAFLGIEKSKFDELGNSFYKQKLSKIILPQFFDFLKQNNIDSNSVVIVSASIQAYLKPFCSQFGFKLISTSLQFKNNQFTGSFNGNNCRGPEKVKRIESEFNLSNYDEIHVFGNSKDDFDMIELATHPYYRYF